MFHYMIVSVGIGGVCVFNNMCRHLGCVRMFHYMRGVGIPSPLLLLLSLPAVHAVHTASDDSCGIRTGNEARVRCLHQFNSVT